MSGGRSFVWDCWLSSPKRLAIKAEEPALVPGVWDEAPGNLEEGADVWGVCDDDPGVDKVTFETVFCEIARTGFKSFSCLILTLSMEFGCELEAVFSAVDTEGWFVLKFNVDEGVVVISTFPWMLGVFVSFWVTNLFIDLLAVAKACSKAVLDIGGLLLTIAGKFMVILGAAPVELFCDTVVEVKGVAWVAEIFGKMFSFDTMFEAVLFAVGDSCWSSLGCLLGGCWSSFAIVPL